MALVREIKVGAFVLAGLFAIGAVVFLIGDERSLFERKSDYRGIFPDVEGLKRGSPVNMGGVDVGAVSEVGYSEDDADPRVYVTFSIVERAQVRVRKDSVVTIAPKGLLGDKMIVVSIGTASEPAIAPGEIVPTGENTGLFARIEKLGAKAEGVMTNLERTTGSLADSELQKDLKEGVRSMSAVLQALDKGEGYAAKLLHDPDEAARLSQTLGNLERTTAELHHTMKGVSAVVSRVNSGPGFAHDLVYGDAPTKTLVQFGEAAGELATTLRGVREGNGLAKSVIYGDDESQQIMSNMSEMSADLRRIVADVRKGKGTLGALLVDPSVYEDLKMVLGNVERNKALRALVRYSIKRDEKGPRVEVRDPAPPAKSSSGD